MLSSSSSCEFHISYQERAHCLMPTEASFEKRKCFIVRSAGKETGGRAQI